MTNLPTHKYEALVTRSKYFDPFLYQALNLVDSEKVTLIHFQLFIKVFSATFKLDQNEWIKILTLSYSSVSYFKLSLKVIPEYNFLNIVMIHVLAMAQNKFLQ